MNSGDLDWCRYSDLIFFIPTGYISVWLCEKHGLKSSIIVGCLLLITGSMVRLVITFGGSIWWWYYGHMISMSSSAFIKTPITKLASNWFGDKERSLATAVCIVSTPFGIFIAKILTILMFDDKDKFNEFPDRTWSDTNSKFSTYIGILSLISGGTAIPAIFLIRNKPPSPPSMVATKPRPMQSLF